MIIYWFVYARKASTLLNASLPLEFVVLGIYLLLILVKEKAIASLVLSSGVVICVLIIGLYLYMFGMKRI
jgi:hypothetical protein